MFKQTILGNILGLKTEWGMRKNGFMPSRVHLPSAFGVFGPGNDSEMGDVADGGQCFAAEAESADRLQVFELVQLGRGEPLADNGHVFFTNAASIIADL